MSSRNKIQANKSVFNLLDKYCSDRKDSIKNAGEIRWIESGDDSDKRFLINSKSSGKISFSPNLNIFRFDFEGWAYFLSSGLEIIYDINQLEERSISGGMLTAFIYEAKLYPTATPSEVRNIVEYEDNSIEGYNGHDANAIKSLFDPIRCYSIKDLTDEETGRVFFLICLSNSRSSNVWMNQRLIETLELISELNPKAIPYKTLCHSLFDVDPGSLFLSLYRCLEALYAYSHTKILMGRIKLETEWIKLAEDLEDVLGWRPREEPSLEALLKKAVCIDLESIANALGETIPENADSVSFVTKKIYQLRNSLVHYRPIHQSFDREKIDWNKLCESTGTLVLDVYHDIFSD